MKALAMNTAKYPADLYELQLRVLESAGIEVVTCPGHTRGEILEHGRDCQGFLTSAGAFDGSIFDQLPECRVVARYGIGYDTVDLDAATARGIVVCNVPDAACAEVADHAMSVILALLRRLPKADADVRRGVWSWLPLRPVRRLGELTLGVVGLGNIGKALAARARPFGFRLLAHDPYVSPEHAAALSVEMVGFPELLARSDVISVHTPLTEKTRGLFDREAFARMKPGSYFVTTARGGVHDQRALHDALAAGHLAGAGLDVFEVEPPAASDPLFSLDSVIVTPHAAGYSEEAFSDVFEKAAWNVVAVLKGFWPRYVVNPRAVPRWPLAPYPGDNRSLLAGQGAREPLGTTVGDAR